MTNQDCYALFSIARSVEIDLNDLEFRYGRLQQEQMIADESEEERTNKMALINEGFRILKDPFLRTLHYLELIGIKLSEAQVDQQWLMRIMNLQEMVIHAKDLVKQGSVLVSFAQELENKGLGVNSLREESNNHLIKGINLIKISQYSKALTELAKVRYLTRLIELIESF